MKLLVLNIRGIAMFQCIFLIEMCQNSEGCGSWFGKRTATVQQDKIYGDSNLEEQITIKSTTEILTTPTPVQKKIDLTTTTTSTIAPSPSENVQNDQNNSRKMYFVLTSSAIAVCAVGIIGSVIWRRRTRGTLKDYCNTRCCTGFRRMNGDQRTGKEKRQSRTSQLHHVTRVRVDEAGHPASAPAPELVYAEIQHSSPKFTYVPRQNVCEYTEIVGVIKG